MGLANVFRTSARDLKIEGTAIVVRRLMSWQAGSELASLCRSGDV